MKILIALLVLSSFVYGQYDDRYEDYEILIRSIEGDVSQVEEDGTFTSGDTIAISFSHSGVARNDNWLGFNASKDIVRFVSNTPLIWNSNTARVEINVDIPVGYWQIRIRTVGKSSINWDNGYRYSDFSDRLDIIVEEGTEGQPARIYIILE